MSEGDRMMESWTPGPYTIKKLGRELTHQSPYIARGFSDLVHSFVGSHKMEPDLRVAMHLRFSRLMGCPICARFFPTLGPKVGLNPVAIHSAMNGHPEALTEKQFGVVTWVDELVTSDGIAPSEIPEPALAISQLLREQIAAATQLELVVHATGLMFLPHSLILRVSGSYDSATS